MRKFLITMIAVIFSTVMFAQEEDFTSNEVVNKKGVSILPAAGDFAIGIDASPVFNLVGNLVKINSGGNFNDPLAFNFVQGNSIYAKYYLTDNSAVRAKFNIDMSSQTYNNFVNDDSNTTDPNATVTDTWKRSSNFVNLGIGYELRRGKGRLQAFYGGELELSIGGGSKDVYTWGNQMSATDSLPTYTTNFFSGTEGTLAIGSSRDTEVKNAGGFGVGLRGFVGVEYFIFPKISIGGEFGWGFGFNSQGEGSASTERWSPITHGIETNEFPTAGASGFGLGTDNLGGQIYLLFHF